MEYDELHLLMPEFEAPKNYVNEEAIERDIKKQELKWLDMAALRPTTGRIEMIGMKTTNGSLTILETLSGANSEKDIVSECINTMSGDIWEDYIFTWGGKRFDIPFLIRKAWHYHIPVPRGLFGRSTEYLNDRFIDLMKAYSCGVYDEKFVSLDESNKFFGFAGKLGKGQDYASMSLDEARKYLERDLMCLEENEKVMRPKGGWDR